MSKSFKGFYDSSSEINKTNSLAYATITQWASNPNQWPVNGGANWTAVNTGLTSRVISTLAVNGNNIFAGTYDNQGVFLSTNNGDTWSPVNTGLGDLAINDLTVQRSNLFAATNNGGIFISTNNGTSWSNNSLTVTRIKTIKTNGSNSFAGGFGLFHSTNNGSSWTPVNEGLTNLYISMAWLLRITTS